LILLCLHIYFDRVVEYLLETLKSLSPIQISNSTIEMAVLTFLQTLEGSFEDAKYLASIAKTGSFKRPKPGKTFTLIDKLSAAVSAVTNPQEDEDDEDGSNAGEDENGTNEDNEGANNNSGSGNDKCRADDGNDDKDDKDYEEDDEEDDEEEEEEEEDEDEEGDDEEGGENGGIREHKNVKNMRDVDDVLINEVFAIMHTKVLKKLFAMLTGTDWSSVA